MTGIIFDETFLTHKAEGHPERPERLSKTVSHLKKSGLWDKCEAVKPRKATPEEIALIHHPEYIKRIRGISESGGGWLDADTYTNEYSYEAALLAAGAGLTAGENVLSGRWSNALALVRPPGHHALAARAMGFCLFNNIAITARWLQKEKNLKKVAIVDWDVHHGNGTQEASYDDSSVLFMSFHRYPFYPGSGHHKETGTGKGKGFTVNVPVQFGISPDNYVAIFREKVEENLASFKPDFILISAGFDAYKDDPIAGLGLEVETFGELTRIVKDQAEKRCNGRIISFLEGGYHLTALPLCAEAHLKLLMGEQS